MDPVTFTVTMLCSAYILALPLWAIAMVLLRNRK